MKAKKMAQRALVIDDCSMSTAVKVWDRYASENAEAILRLALHRALSDDIIAIGLLMELWKAAPKAARRSRVVGRVRKRIIQKFEYRCYHCTRKGSQDRDPDGLYWNLDHLIPVCEGGSDDLDNLVLSCVRCNSDKGRTLNWEPSRANVL